MEYIVALFAGVILLYLAAKLVSLPFRLVWKFISNSIIGGIMLWGINLLGVGIEITLLKAFCAGFFGIPGVIGILVMHYIG